MYSLKGNFGLKKYKCLCCGYRTLDTRGEYDICPVCFWEDDAYLIFSETKIKGIYKEEALKPLLSSIVSLCFLCFLMPSVLCW